MVWGCCAGSGCAQLCPGQSALRLCHGPPWGLPWLCPWAPSRPAIRPCSLAEIAVSTEATAHRTAGPGEPPQSARCVSGKGHGPLGPLGRWACGQGGALTAEGGSRMLGAWPGGVPRSWSPSSVSSWRAASDWPLPFPCLGRGGVRETRLCRLASSGCRGFLLGVNFPGVWLGLWRGGRVSAVMLLLSTQEEAQLQAGCERAGRGAAAGRGGAAAPPEQDPFPALSGQQGEWVSASPRACALP